MPRQVCRHMAHLTITILADYCRLTAPTWGSSRFGTREGIGSVKARSNAISIVLVLPILAFVVTLTVPVSAQAPADLPTGLTPRQRGHELVPDPDAVARAKEAAAQAAEGDSVAKPEINVAAPVSLAGFDGIYDTSTGPPDTTIAVGSTRLIEMVNSRFGIYDRSSNLLSEGPLRDLVGATSADFISDPQVMWDPETERFFFVIFENHANGPTSPDEGLAWGFSRNASPSSAADWCQYFSRFSYAGTSFPDFPRLGDTKGFLLIGTNRFSLSESYLGADLAWITKPGPGTKCRSERSFRKGNFTDLRNADGTQTFTPVPARQVDGSRDGWVVATPFPWSAPNALTLYRVERKGAGLALSAPASVAVPTYRTPPNAPQAGTTSSGSPAPYIDTLSGKLTQAYSSFDPRFGNIAVWTAHTVAGGAGSELRWYEIDPADLTLDQWGEVSDPTLYAFNGAIAPDRAVDGSQALFGSAAVLGFSTSSATSFPAVQMVSKVADNPQSGFVLVTQSPGPNVDFNCFQPTRPACRWGDYSGAAPDPVASADSTTGVVWLSNQWNVASVTDDDVDWRTWNWTARP